MEKKEVWILLVLGIVLIFGCWKLGVNQKKNLKEAEGDISETSELISNQVIVQEAKEYVEQSEDGTKINKSSKLIEEKMIGNLKISNILLTSKNYETSFMADVENIGTEVKEETEIQISLFDENEELIISFPGFISKTEPGETAKINVTLSDSDFTNAYNVEIVEK